MLLASEHGEGQPEDGIRSKKVSATPAPIELARSSKAILVADAASAIRPVVDEAAPRQLALAALAGAAILWGLVPVANRSLLSDLPPLPLVVARFAATSLLVAPLFAASVYRHPWTGGDHVRAAAAGLTGIVGYNVTVTFGVDQVTASRAALILASEPLLIALMAAAFAGERLTLPIVFGGVVAVAGIALLVTQVQHETIHRNTLVGSLLVLAAAVSFAASALIARPLTRRQGAIAATASSTVFGTAALAPFAPFADFHSFRDLDGSDLSALALLILGSGIVGAVLWNWGLARVPGGRGAAFIYLIPLVGVVGGVVLLGETLTVPMVAGGALVLAGAGLAQGRGRRLRAASVRPEKSKGRARGS